MNKIFKSLTLIGPALILGFFCARPGLAQTNEEACDGVLYDAKEVTQRVKLTSNPIPEYTREARLKKVHGKVVITAAFCRNGTIIDIKVVKGLPYGLTENALKAIREIKFQPAKKDGDAVSQRLRKEYTFRIY